MSMPGQTPDWISGAVTAGMILRTRHITQRIDHNVADGCLATPDSR